MSIVVRAFLPSRAVPDDRLDEPAVSNVPELPTEGDCRDGGIVHAVGRRDQLQGLALGVAEPGQGSGRFDPAQEGQAVARVQRRSPRPRSAPRGAYAVQRD